MNKRFLFVIGTAVLCLCAVLFVSSASAALFDNKAAMEEKKAALEAKAREALRSREWAVYMTAKGEKSAGETDVFIFGDGTMESKNLSAVGYPVSNISISVGNDGTVVWETMKTTAAKDKAFYRGELRGSVMTGTVVMKSSKAKISTFSFSSAAASAPAVITESKTAVKETAKSIKK